MNFWLGPTFNVLKSLGVVRLRTRAGGSLGSIPSSAFIPVPVATIGSVPLTVAVGGVTLTTLDRGLLVNSCKLTRPSAALVPGSVRLTRVSKWRSMLPPFTARPMLASAAARSSPVTCTSPTTRTLLPSVRKTWSATFPLKPCVTGGVRSNPAVRASVTSPTKCACAVAATVSGPSPLPKSRSTAWSKCFVNGRSISTELLGASNRRLRLLGLRPVIVAIWLASVS